MDRWQEYDPNSGMLETNVADEDGNRVVVHKQQDVSALLDRNAELANTGATDSGIKKGLWHYASVPLTVQYELLTKYGLNFFDNNHTARIFEVINRDYPRLKTTHRNHLAQRRS